MSKEVKIQEIGAYFHIDQDGYLINPASIEKIQEEWKPLVEDIVSVYQQRLGDALHSVYIRGSVVKGGAIKGISDVDTFAYANLLREEIKTDWLDTAEKEVLNKYPFAQGIEFSIDPVTAAHEDRLMLMQSACIFGTDLTSTMPKLKPGKNMVVHALTLEKRYQWLRDKLETLEDEEELRKGCLWLMKLFLRTGFELTMERSKTYTRDLYPCYKTFSEYYPEKESEMREVLKLALNPVADKEKLLFMMDGFGQWLEDEVEKQNLR